MKRSMELRLPLILGLLWAALAVAQAPREESKEALTGDRDSPPPVGWTQSPIREEKALESGPVEDPGDKTEMRPGDNQPLAGGKAWLNDVLVTDPAIDTVEQAMCSTPDGILFVAVEMHDSYDGWIYVYRSLDHGNTWSQYTGFRTGTYSRNPAITYAENTSGDEWVFLAYEAELSSGTKWIMVIRFDPYDIGEWDYVNASGDITGTTEDIYPRICTDNLHFSNSYYVYLVYTANYIDNYPALFTRSLDQGETFETPLNLTGGAENSSNVTRPDVAYGTGGLYVAFEKLGWTGTEYQREVWVTKSTGYGASSSWSAPLQLTTAAEGAWHPAVSAAHGVSTVLVAYTRAYSTDTDINYAYSLDGGSTYSMNNALPWTNDNEKSVSLSVSDSSGYFHAAFWHGYDVCYTQTPVTNPRSWTPTVIVNDANWASSTYSRPATCVNSTKPVENEACVAWTDYRGANYDVYFDAQFFDGACCLLDESCVEVLESECDELGGTWMGSDVECTPELCIIDPCEEDVGSPVAVLDLTDFDCIAYGVQTSINGTAMDPEDNLLAWTLEIRAADGTSWDLLDMGTSPVVDGVLANWVPTSARYHLIRLTVEDVCGHTSTDTRLVYIDQGPSARINYPNNGSVIGGSSVCIDIYATHGVCPREWVLDYRFGTGSWVELTRSGGGVYNQTAYSWDTTGLTEGAYTIRLVNTSIGGSAVDAVGVIVDNTAPVVSITDPVNCTRVDGTVAIYGSVYDDNLQSWTLQWTGGPSDDWNTIQTGTGNISGLLHTWDTTGLPDCPYTIRLVAHDKARINCTNDAHWSETMVTIQLGDFADDADLDNDGDVDLHDYMLFQGEFTGPY